jgi:hypothetical protein
MFKKRPKEPPKKRHTKKQKKKGNVQLERFLEKKRKKRKFCSETYKLTVFRISKFPETKPTKKKGTFS